VDKPVDDNTLEWLFARTRSGAARGTERTRELLEKLGNPQAQFPAIHVIGTNGKGSVCAMLEAGLRSTGIRVGRFTSPHLLEFSERILVDGLQIPASEVTGFVDWAQASQLEAAFFDFVTAMAFKYFADQNVDLAVIEAGVGGLHDATNNLEHIQLTIITNVDFDHVEALGGTLERITLEKAGAIRPGIPVVTAAQGVPLEIISGIALERHAPLHIFDLESPLFALPQAPALRGSHQLENAALVAAALRILEQPESSINAAMQATWAGRFEIFDFQNREYILDGAHNPAGARALAENLEPGFALIFGVMAKKNVHAVLEPLRLKASSVSFVSPGELGADPKALALEFDAQAFESLELALETINASKIVIAGSLYLVGRARAWLLKAGASLRLTSGHEPSDNNQSV
jgi:dihydrofolate synthase / folylpolyglutamate synthase